MNEQDHRLVGGLIFGSADEETTCCAEVIGGTPFADAMPTPNEEKQNDEPNA